MKTGINSSQPNFEAQAAASTQPLRAPLAPLLAGARARGVADGLDLVGAAAALLDEHGEVLHVNARALGLMGEGLFLSEQRLRASDQEADETLAAAIDASVRHRVPARVALNEPTSEGVAAVRIVPVAAAAEGEDVFQLLRAVAIFEAASDRFPPVVGLN